MNHAQHWPWTQHSTMEGKTMENTPYTMQPTHIRIFNEGDGWAVDGADNVGRYTVEIFKYDTYAEAVAAIPAFIAETTVDGYVWQWQQGRKPSRVAK